MKKKRAAHARKAKVAPRERFKKAKRARRNVRARPPVDVRRVASALRRFDHAQCAAVARGADLLAVSRQLGQTAVKKHDEEIVREFLHRQLPRDIVALSDAFASAPNGSLPQWFEDLRLLPEALIRWMADQFEIESQGQVGQEIEVPAEALRTFTHDIELPADLKGLVRIRITAPGWKRRGKLIARAHVALADAKPPQVD